MSPQVGAYRFDCLSQIVVQTEDELWVSWSTTQYLTCYIAPGCEYGTVCTFEYRAGDIINGWNMKVFSIWAVLDLWLWVGANISLFLSCLAEWVVEEINNQQLSNVRMVWLCQSTHHLYIICTCTKNEADWKHWKKLPCIFISSRTAVQLSTREVFCAMCHCHSVTPHSISLSSSCAVPCVK